MLGEKLGPVVRDLGKPAESGNQWMNLLGGVLEIFLWQTEDTFEGVMNHYHTCSLLFMDIRNWGKSFFVSPRAGSSRAEPHW